MDFKYAEALDDEYRKLLSITERKLEGLPEIQRYRRTRGTFSPSNPDHVLAMLKDEGREEIYVEEKGKTRISTDEGVLSSIPHSELASPKLILDHREISKLQGTYIGPILDEKIVGVDGKIHSKYSSTVAVTNRLASEDPNAQNFPKRKHKKVRGVVVPDRRSDILMPCDYGQIEFRVVGMCSEDDNLVRHCWTGYDVHKHWAERLKDVYPRIVGQIEDEFEIDWDDKGLKTLRQEMKNKWVFPMFFGSQVSSCATQLNVPLGICDDLAEEFWDEFPGVREWQARTKAFYDKHNYVEDLLGHKRRGPTSYNELINLPIQGTAAQIVKGAHTALAERSQHESDPELCPVLNVHDDLTFNVRAENRDAKAIIIAREMCQRRFGWINVPLLVEMSSGPRWSEAEEFKVWRSDDLFPDQYKNPYR